jgi:hypothetical protein
VQNGAATACSSATTRTLASGYPIVVTPEASAVV